MKKQLNNLKSLFLMLILMLGVGTNVWAETNTKTEGFETAKTSTYYQGTVTINEQNSDCGIKWEIYYGCVSTTNKISGNNSAALRLYTSNNYGYIKTISPIEGLKKVSFNAKAETSYSANIKVNISYSKDGTNWVALETNQDLTKSSGNYSYDIPLDGRYFMIDISDKSTKPSQKSVQLTIDDIVFTYEDDTPSTTYVKVTNRNQVVKGNKYILVNAGSTAAMGKVAEYGQSVSVGMSNNKISVRNNTVNVLTLKDSGKSDWLITSSLENDQYLSWSSGNTLKSVSEIPEDDANVRWKIRYDDNGDISIRNAKDETRYIQYNALDPRFACYTSTQQKIALYVEEGSPTIETATVSIEATSLIVGNTTRLTVEPTGLEVSIESDNQEVVTAENGVLTAVGKGEATITATWEEQTINGSMYRAGSQTFTITVAQPEQAGAEVPDGYYNIKTSEGKFINVAGRKTVTLVDDAKGKAGTIIRISADGEGVKVLRSQGVDLPGYVKKAMNYVPEIVQMVVDKLRAEGEGSILGETGLKKIMKKFDESFDYNLYLEEGDGGTYRIYGRTPSMKPVVDFYAENKADVDAKLPQLEEFINSAIQKLLKKTGGSGASILVAFNLEEIWERMGGTLTNPREDQAKFYEEVLSSETNVWNFAYQTAMLYWGNLKNHEKFKEIEDNLGDYAKYIDKVEYIRPNVKYYIVPSGSSLDIISEDDSQINDASTAWTIEECTQFNVNVPENNQLNGKYYTTLYTDFAYTLPEGMKAYKVTEITEKYGVAKREELTGIIPAQTPVLIEATQAGDNTITLSTEEGTPVTGNLLVGADALINQYDIQTGQVVALFDMAKNILGEDTYDEYLSPYEHLKRKNAGTVNNKYFFGLTEEDVEQCVYGEENDCVIRSLSTGDEKTGFYGNWEAKANQAFLVSETFDPVRLTLLGDINRDGDITISDVTALVNIILGKVTIENDSDLYDFEAADVNQDEDISISDVTALVNIILGKQ